MSAIFVTFFLNFVWHLFLSLNCSYGLFNKKITQKSFENNAVNARTVRAQIILCGEQREKRFIRNFFNQTFFVKKMSLFKKLFRPFTLAGSESSAERDRGARRI